MRSPAVWFRRGIWVAGACAALLAVAAVPAMSAAAVKKCSATQIYAGKCGNLPTRSCLSMIPASKFRDEPAGAGPGSGIGNPLPGYDDPEWVAGTAPGVSRACVLVEEIVGPNPGYPEFDDVAKIDLYRYPSVQTTNVQLKNFCVTSPSVAGLGSFVYIPGAGRKACVNNTLGAGYMGADNYFVVIDGFAASAGSVTDVTPTEALKTIAMKLLG